MMLCFVTCFSSILLVLPNGDEANDWCILTVGIFRDITGA